MDRARREGHPPLKGPDAALTLDAKLQQAVYQAFGARAGVVVVADGRSGEILAAVSGPSFDPNEIGRDWQQLRADPRSPLIERVGGGLYPVLRADGSPLLQADKVAGHPWFGENPFPLYPGASSALQIDGAVLFSPLMLLAIAAQLPGSESRAFFPVLVRSQTVEGEATPNPLADPSKSYVPSVEETEARPGWKLFALRGPKFRESPPFQVMLGRTDGGEAPLAFAFVIENAEAADAARLRDGLLPVLLNWTRRAPGKQG